MTVYLSQTYTSVVVLSGAADNPATIGAAALLRSGLYADSLSAAAWTVTNAGSVLGSGITLQSMGTLINRGEIASGGAGVDLQAGGYVANASNGMIAGGYGSGPGDAGEDGVDLAAFGTLSNSGMIVAGIGGFEIQGGSVLGNGGAGGRGIRLEAGGTLTNTGTVAGGSGGFGGFVPPPDGPAGAGGSGGTGVYLAAGTDISNAGAIAGGDGGPGGFGTGGGTGGSGGVGLDLRAAGILTNTGIISGGYGGGGGSGELGGGSGGSGGDAIDLTAGATVANSGTITGGSGAAGVALDAGGSGGNGGWGIFLAAGGLITNGGVISGGSGGAGAFGFVHRGTTGDGGGGVYVSGGTLVTSGTITGGAGAQNGDAVRFGSLAGTLVVDSGAVFVGSVDGGDTVGAASASTLELASGASVGTLSALGTQFVDFAQVTVDTGARWALLATDTIESGVTLTNAGTVSGGVTLAAGGKLSNTSTGTVAVPGGSAVYGLSGAAATIVNAGLIATADGPAGQGISLAGGGSVTNQRGGYITGYDGICANGAVTVANAGSIAGDAGGIKLLAGGNVTNQDGGTITGAFYGVDGADVPLTLINAGIIAPLFVNVAGVRLFAGGYVTNQSGGTVSGGTGILSSGGAMTVVNAGDITGTGVDAVQFAAGYANRLVVDPASVFGGIVTGGNIIGASAVSTLELAGTSAGMLSGIGTQFVDFAQTTIDAGASWTLTGANTFAAGTTLWNAGTLTMQDTALSDAGLVLNDGAIDIDSSGVTLARLAGTGTVAITGGSTLDIVGSVAAGATIVFDSARNLLDINPAAFTGRVDGFTFGGTIGLAGVTDGFSAGIINGNTLQIERSFHPAVDLTLDPLVDYAGDRYAVSPEGAVTETPCFLRGTLIRTERGEVPVQHLAVGDRVVTSSRQIRPIVWIGSGRVLVSPGRRCAATPIIVRKGALADGVPHQDLSITKGHSLFIDGVLIPAEFLINHRSILWDDDQRMVAFYHIELETHDVLIANGAAAESYRDDGNRWLFRNANGAWDQPPKPQCVPVLTGGPIVDAVWKRLLQRAAKRSGVTLTDDPDLHLLVNGVRLDAAKRTRDVYVFTLPHTRAAVRIVSRAAAPQESGLARDPRRLGIALRRIVVRKMARFRVANVDDRLLTDGFHAFEPANDIRWTDGNAVLPVAMFGGFDGAVELVLQLGGSTRYPAFIGAAAHAAA